MTTCPSPEGANPFDELAPFYDSWLATPLGATVGALERDLFLQLTRPRKSERALEVGVGTGYFAEVVVGTGAQVVGVDLSLPMLQQAARKQLPVALLRSDGAALPFRAQAFDLVYSVTVLEFVPDPARALAQMWAMLRPGGRLVAAVLNRWSPWARRKAPPFDRAHYFTPPELVGMLRSYGPVSWSSSVFFLPSCRGLRHAAGLERLGRAFCRPCGALLVARVDKAGQT